MRGTAVGDTNVVGSGWCARIGQRADHHLWSFCATTMRRDVLPIIEIFHSIQGEGTRVGEPATFIRLAGCNLRCTWCDTPYSWSAEGIAAAAKRSIEDIAEDVREAAVVITGGEPMLHARRLGALVEALRSRGVSHITVETNGTIFDPELTALVDLWSLSPKLPASGESFPHDTVIDYLAARASGTLDGSVQLKFVCAEVATDWEAMWSHLSRIPASLLADVEILVQPDGLREDYSNAIRELAEHVIADTGEAHPGCMRRARVRVVPQVHRIAWGAAARGV